MKKDYSYWIIPVYMNENWKKEFLLINQKTENWNFWWFPKWHAEKWETELESAKRELKEEVWISDINVDQNKFRLLEYNFKLEWTQYYKTVKYRIAYVNNKKTKIQEKELNKCERYEFDKALEKITHKNMKKIFIEMIQK